MSNRKPLAIILALVLFGMIAPIIRAPYVPGTGNPNYSISFSITDPTMTSLTLGASPVNTQFWAYVWLNNATIQTMDNAQGVVGVGGISVHVDFSGILTYCAPIGFLNYVTGNVGIGSLIGVFNSSTPGELLLGLAAGFYNSDGPVAGPPYTGATWYNFETSTTHATAWYTTYVPPGEPQETAGLVAAIEFNVTGQPAIAQPDFVGQIGFTSDLLTKLVDFSSALDINFDEFPGTLTVPATVPAPYAYPTTEPEIYLSATYNPVSSYVPGNPGPTFDMSGQALGYMFNVTVALANNKGTLTGVDPIWDVAGFDVSLTWNNTLINFVQGYEGRMLSSGGCTTIGLNGGSFTNGFAIYPPVGDQDTAEAVFTKTTDPIPCSGIGSLAIFEFQVAYVLPSGLTVDSPIALVHNSTSGFYQPDLDTWAHPEISSPPWNSSLTIMDMGPPNAGPITWTANGGFPIPAGFFGVGPDADYHAGLSYMSITFDQRGVDYRDFNGTVVTINGTPYNASGLPVTFSWPEYSSQSFSYASPLYVNASYGYTWWNTSGISSLQSNSSLIITTSGYVNATYGLIGDVSHDGKVSLADLTMFASAYNSIPGDANWNPECDLAPPYGIIDLTDLVTLAIHYT